MTIWELKNGSINDVASLVYSDQSDLAADIFGGDGRALEWSQRPRAEILVEPRQKKPKPRVDISALRPGALVLNGRAKEILGEFLSQFGQLLELDVEGSAEWFYNVTNVIDAIDFERSEKRASGTISKEVFYEDKLPVVPAIFKCSQTARAKIYANDAAKVLLEQLMARDRISGATFAEPGAPARPPR